MGSEMCIRDRYEPPRSLEVIKGEIDELESQIIAMLKGLSA